MTLADPTDALRQWAESLDYRPRKLSFYVHTVLVYFEDETYQIPRERMGDVHPQLLDRTYDYFKLAF